MFESFNNKNQSDAEFHERTVFSIILSIVLGVAIIFIVAIWLEPSPSQTILQPEITPEQRVEKLCASLPTPENFKLISKDKPNQYYRRVAVDYKFFSYYRTIEEIIPTFVMWFDENGWTQNIFDTENGEIRLEFKKNNQTIILKSPRYVTAYTITCAESAES